MPQATPAQGAAAAGASAIVALIGGIFGNHTKAKQTEASALNTAVPLTQKSISTIFDYLNAGQLTPEQAMSALDLTTGQYENLVYKQFDVKRKPGNGPDFIENSYVDKWIAAAKSLINAGGGTYTADALNPPGNGFAGFSSFTINYKPAPAASDTNGTPTSQIVDIGQPNILGVSTTTLFLVIAAVVLIAMVLK